MSHFSPEYLACFIDMHSENILGAKFLIGERVLYNGNNHEILAVNVQDKDNTEYAITNHSYLVWETDLTSVKDI